MHPAVSETDIPETSADKRSEPLPFVPASTSIRVLKGVLKKTLRAVTVDDMNPALAEPRPARR